MQRLFIAIDMADKVKDYIKSFTESAPELRWTKLDQLHITVKFLGDTADELCAQIKTSLKSIEWKSFELTIRNTGFFPNKKKAEVFWLGMDEFPELVTLKNAVDNSLLPLGILPAKREFSPHLTLMRIKYHEQRILPEKLEKLFESFKPQTFKVNSFYLYSSKLDRAGAIHTKEAEYNS